MTKFTIGQCIERNGVPQLAGQIYDIDDTNYHIYRFGRQGLPGYEFQYGITDTENLFHEVQCIDPTHKWETPRPLPDASAPAQGRLESLTYPASVEHGEYFEVHCDVYNIGGSSGTFKLRYSINGTVVYTGARWNIPAGGVTENAGGVFAPAPQTGSSMTVKLELIMET